VANALAFWQGSQILKPGSSSGSAGTVYAIVFLIRESSFVIGQAGPFFQSFSQAGSAGRRTLDLIDYPDTSIDVYSKLGVQDSRETLEKIEKSPSRCQFFISGTTFRTSSRFGQYQDQNGLCSRYRRCLGKREVNNCGLVTETI
jgi:hypothetical protein